MNTKIKVWVVDDERSIRVSLADDLRDAGYEVLEFANTNAVLTRMADLTPDIIISDLKMPGIDGIELLTKVKEINLEINNFRKENKLLREKIETEYNFSSYIGDIETNKELFDLIKLVSHKDTTV